MRLALSNQPPYRGEGSVWQFKATVWGGPHDGTPVTITVDHRVGREMWEAQLHLPQPDQRLIVEAEDWQISQHWRGLDR